MAYSKAHSNDPRSQHKVVFDMNYGVTSFLVLAFATRAIAQSACGAEGPLQLAAGESMHLNAICQPAGSMLVSSPDSYYDAYSTYADTSVFRGQCHVLGADGCTLVPGNVVSSLIVTVSRLSLSFSTLRSLTFDK